MTIEKLHQLFIETTGISTDTRKLVPGTLFFALKGGHFNGNEFAARALEEGCAYAVVDEERVVVSDRYILVDDVLKTLQQLANFHRRQFSIPVIGITGSNGKTTTKELIGAVLETTYNVLVTEGNLNNHLGVPFTLLRLNMDHEIAVIEMGANKPGDIRELCEIAEPTHGIITNIGAAHIEGFGSLQGVIETKTELYRFIEKTGGTLFVHEADKTLTGKLPANTRIIAYGGNSSSVNGFITELTPYVNFTWTTTEYTREKYTSPVVRSQLVGSYNFTNFLAAISIGRYFDVSPEAINEALSGYVPSNKRSQVEKTERNTLIVDCYNANATSMKAALENFVDIPHRHKVAILGDMLELGPISGQEHQKIVDYLSDQPIRVYLVGKEFSSTNTGFKKFASVEDLLQKEDLGEIRDALVLIKGSRGIRLEGLIDRL